MFYTIICSLCCHYKAMYGRVLSFSITSKNWWYMTKRCFSSFTFTWTLIININSSSTNDENQQIVTSYHIILFLLLLVHAVYNVNINILVHYRILVFLIMVLSIRDMYYSLFPFIVSGLSLWVCPQGAVTGSTRQGNWVKYRVMQITKA